MKLKLIELDREFPGRLTVTVHDEVGLSLDKGDVRSQELARDIYSTFGHGSEIALRIPILASVGLGPNWYEAGK
jgi:DNA polymerase I-like protein with 3'-5' exonuclease and polymerase domains